MGILFVGLLTTSYSSNNMKMNCSSGFAFIFLVALCNSSLPRKKRQIMDAINALTEATLEAERMEAILKEEVQKQEGQGNKLKCSAAVNSQCRGKKCVVSCSDGKGAQVALNCESGFVDVRSSSGNAAIVEVACGSVVSSEVVKGKALEMEKVVTRQKRESSNTFFQKEGFKNVQRGNTPGLFGNVQQCQGGRCDQLNLLSSRKRQIREAMETLTQEVDKFEKEVEQLEKDLLSQALAAHAAAEAAVRAQQAQGPGTVGASGNIGASGIVGASGNIGPSGLCGPTGCIAF